MRTTWTTNFCSYCTSCSKKWCRRTLEPCSVVASIFLLLGLCDDATAGQIYIPTPGYSILYLLNARTIFESSVMYAENGHDPPSTFPSWQNGCFRSPFLIYRWNQNCFAPSLSGIETVASSDVKPRQKYSSSPNADSRDTLSDLGNRQLAISRRQMSVIILMSFTFMLLRQGPRHGGMLLY